MTKKKKETYWCSECQSPHDVGSICPLEAAKKEIEEEDNGFSKSFDDFHKVNDAPRERKENIKCPYISRCVEKKCWECKE